MDSNNNEADFGEGWESVDRALQSQFLKWSDGPFELLFLDQPPPRVRVNHWVGGRPSPCDGARCLDCAKYERGDDNYRPKRSILFHVKQLIDGEWEDRKFDMSPSAVKELKKVREQLGPEQFAKTAFHCNKQGAGSATRYTFSPQGGPEAFVGVSSTSDDDIGF